MRIRPVPVPPKTATSAPAQMTKYLIAILALVIPLVVFLVVERFGNATFSFWDWSSNKWQVFATGSGAAITKNAGRTGHQFQVKLTL